ncbi:anti-sigma factor family protein [Glaciibacter sp. 2TAF33]|uniref:anti-sigma factor family protein n=1 Tax=Glaciibacter sp. 2TAF33 TaxID=3233015 RepID=UPI003F91E8BA
MMDDRYSDWDAAYVIGALSADERREYERHLAACDACRDQVAELAGMPGLLAAVPVAQAVAAGAADPARSAAGAPTHDEERERMPAASLPRLLAAAKTQRRRSRAVFAGVVTVTAGLAASLALVLPGWIAANPAPAAPQAVTAVLEQVVPSPLSAEVTLADHAWGTRIDSNCAYAETLYASGAQAYAMYVTDRQGQRSEVATWLAKPGSTVEAVGTTWLRARDIAAVDIRSVATGQVLLESRLADG